MRSLFTFIASASVMTPAARPRHRSSPLPPHEFRRAPGAVRQRHLGQAEEVEIDEGVQHQVKAHDADDPQHRFLARPLQLLPDRLHASFEPPAQHEMKPQQGEGRRDEDQVVGDQRGQPLRRGPLQVRQQPRGGQVRQGRRQLHHRHRDAQRKKSGQGRGAGGPLFRGRRIGADGLVAVNKHGRADDQLHRIRARAPQGVAKPVQEGVEPQHQQNSDGQIRCENARHVRGHGPHRHRPPQQVQRHQQGRRIDAVDERQAEEWRKHTHGSGDLLRNFRRAQAASPPPQSTEEYAHSASLSTPLRAPPTAIATASAPCYITSGNGGCTALLISLLIFAITLFFILWRPRGIREAWFAAGGAALMGAAGFVGWSDVVRLWAETGDVLAFLAGMLVVGYVADQAGVFSWLAYHTARLSRGSGVRLYVGLYLIGVFVTVWFSLDTTAVVLAPIVYSLVQALGLPPL